MSYVLETWCWPRKALAAQDCLVDGHQWLRYGGSEICNHCGAVLEKREPCQ